MSTEDELRSLALSLPGTEEREAWNQPTFRVGGKIFAWLGKPRRPAGIRVSEEEREELLAAEPDKFFMVAEDARGPWMRLRLEAIEPDELLELLTDTWRAVAPKRLLTEHEEL